MIKFVFNFFLALPVICILSSFSSGHDGGDIIRVSQMKQEPSHASHLTDDGYFDGLLYYKITSNSTNEVALVKVESSALMVDIPSQVIIEGKTYTCTRIEDNAFFGLNRMTSVTIPNSVTSIGSYAFANCRGLTSINIPNNVTFIGSDAFVNCSGLTSVHITDLDAWCRIEFVNSLSNPLSKADHLYLNGVEIKNLVIPNSVTSIGDYTFSGCNYFTSITIHNSVTSIGSGAFSNCNSLTDVTIPNSVTSIGSYAFSGSSLTSITIPNSVTSIGRSAFSYCSGLTSITIPNSVTSIGLEAFSHCFNIKEVVSMIENPFEIWGKEPNYGIFDTNIFNNSTLYVPVGTLNKYKSTKGWKDFAHIMEIGQEEVSEGVTYSYDKGTHTLTISGQGPMKTGWEKVPWDSFKKDIQKVIIESGVTSIGNYAFSSCSSITSFTIGNSVTSIGEWAFSGCIELTSITIPNSVTSIGPWAFMGCIELTSITIPNSVTSIGKRAFEDCYSLASITIPKSVTSIGNYVFL